MARRRRRRAVTAPVPAKVLEIHHHDDRRTEYRDVEYWLWRDGVTVYEGGVEIAAHDDVLRTIVNAGAN
jgi:hypothetical protein